METVGGWHGHPLWRKPRAVIGVLTDVTTEGPNRFSQDRVGPVLGGSSETVRGSRTLIWG